MTRLVRVAGTLLALALLLLAATLAWQWWQPLDLGHPAPAAPAAVAAPATTATSIDAGQLQRGAYLARAGNCAGCHTPRGAAPYSGGRALGSEFGTFYSTNITPDRETGIGLWDADDFWRALHHGRGRDGRFLYPAFPFPSYTRVSRADADALFAYLQSLAPVRRVNTPHALPFPYDQRWLLAGWRALFFRPGSYQDDTARTAQWNRGAYLVQGLGHCAGCHSPRNTWGASRDPLALAGGLVPVLDWYAPPLHGGPDALGGWDDAQLAALLRSGVSMRGAVAGPMAEVVGKSLQYLTPEDAQAMAVYLKSLPTAPADTVSTSQPGPAEAERIMQLGGRLYGQLCVDCHNAHGQGIAPDYPPLAGNRAISQGPAVNAIRIVINGGYPPSTDANPYPFGMPPFGPRLSDQEVAAVVSYIRNSWGQHGGFVSAAEVNRYRAVPMD